MLISSKMISMSVRLDELSLIAYKVVDWSFSCAISDRDLMIGKKSVIRCCFRSIIGKKSVISCCFRCSTVEHEEKETSQGKLWLTFSHCETSGSSVDSECSETKERSEGKGSWISVSFMVLWA